MGWHRSKNSLRYAIALAVFLCYLATAFMVFFARVDSAVNQNTVELLQSNVQQQSYHFEAVIELQFNTLEVASSYIGMQPQKLTVEQMEDILQSLSSTDTFGRTMLILPDGTGYSSDGIVTQVGDRAYFQTAMSGQRAMSNPLSSSVDGDNKVVLAVPVERDGQVTAVLGGSYDVGALSSLLFADIYEGKGYSFIVTGGRLYCEHRHCRGRLVGAVFLRRIWQGELLQGLPGPDAYGLSEQEQRQHHRGQPGRGQLSGLRASGLQRLGALLCGQRGGRQGRL